MERLRGLDTAFLYMETPTNHLHVAWAAVLDTSSPGASGVASPERLAEVVAARLHLLGPLRRRLVEPRLGYTQPDWLDVEVDPRDHIVVHEADGSGGLERIAAAVLERRLDRRRPLWELHLVRGLPDGRTGLIMKLHHALLDGPSGAELMVQLLDLEPGPARAGTGVDTPPADGSAADRAVKPVDREPTAEERAELARRRLSRGTARVAAAVRQAVDVGGAVQRWDLDHAGAGLPVPLSAPRTPLNRPITGRRVVRFTGLPLDVVDELRRPSGATVNDAVLAITGGALRRYLRRHHALPLTPLQAMVPMSVRAEADSAGGRRGSAGGGGRAANGSGRGSAGRPGAPAGERAAPAGERAAGERAAGERAERAAGERAERAAGERAERAAGERAAGERAEREGERAAGERAAGERAAGERAAPAAGGNQLSALLTTLGTDVADLGDRVALVSRVTAAAKRRHDETRLGSLVGLTDLVPPRAAQGLARLAGRLGLSSWAPLPFNVVVSNVPGPDVPFYCDGAVVERAYPMGPLTDWSALNVTVVSYRRWLAFGLVACPDVIPDLDDLVADLEAELAPLGLEPASA